MFQHSQSSHSHVTPPSDKTLPESHLTEGHGCSSPTAHFGIKGTAGNARAGFGGFWEPFLQPGLPQALSHGLVTSSSAWLGPAQDLSWKTSLPPERAGNCRREGWGSSHPGWQPQLLFLHWHQATPAPRGTQHQSQAPFLPQFKGRKIPHQN